MVENYGSECEVRTGIISSKHFIDISATTFCRVNRTSKNVSNVSYNYRCIESLASKLVIIKQAIVKM